MAAVHKIGGHKARATGWGRGIPAAKTSYRVPKPLTDAHADVDVVVVVVLEPRRVEVVLRDERLREAHVERVGIVDERIRRRRHPFGALGEPVP